MTILLFTISMRHHITTQAYSSHLQDNQAARSSYHALQVWLISSFSDSSTSGSGTLTSGSALQCPTVQKSTKVQSKASEFANIQVGHSSDQCFLID